MLEKVVALVSNSRTEQHVQLYRCHRQIWRCQRLRCQRLHNCDFWAGVCQMADPLCSPASLHSLLLDYMDCILCANCMLCANCILCANCMLCVWSNTSIHLACEWVGFEWNMPQNEDVQPNAFVVSFNPIPQTQSNLSLFNGTWQKKHREQHDRMSFEIGEMTLQMQ